MARGWRANVLVEVNAAVGKFAELSSLLDLCGTKALSAIWVLVVHRVRVHPPAPKSNLSPRQISITFIIVVRFSQAFHSFPRLDTGDSLRGMGGTEVGFNNVPAASSAF